MIPRVWRLLAGYIAAPRQTLAALAILAAVAGLVEAGILVIVVNVAAALARDDATEPIEVPVIGASALVGTLIVMAMVGTVVLLLLHTAITRLNARLSSGVLQGTRRRVIVAFFEADVLVHEPLVGAHPLDAVTTRVGLDADTVDGVDAVVLLADHDVIDYGALDRASYVFDARNRLRGHGVERL
jgi:hypothetical protein